MRQPNVPDGHFALLPALRLLLEERSVTRAAERAGMSQPAMSRVLARLRRLFGDELLVRGPAGSAPTARALALAEELPAALDEVARVIQPPRFEPAAASASFTIATVDYIAMVLLSAVVERVRREAPGIELDIRTVGGLDLADALAQGSADLLIGAKAEIEGRSGLFHQRLFDEEYACLVPRRVAAGIKSLTLEAYLALPHALVTITGRGGGAIDAALENAGRARRVALRIQNFLAAPWVVAGSDLAIILPRRLAERVAKPAGFVIFDVPVDLGTLTLSQVWHARRHKDPAHAWLREVIATSARALDRAHTPRRAAKSAKLR
ncbi:MAG TPA: LysR family transcriptional regulator [Alphaproteobacteria bacterium]|jgi:DNA-binding transcriptional LysR family regulator